MGLKYIVPAVLLIIFPAQSQNYPDKNVHDMLMSGIEKLLSQDYGDAEKIFHHLQQVYPKLPLGDTYLAVTSILRSYDLKIEYDSEFINSSLNRAAFTVESLLKKDGNSLWYNYFLAIIKGYSSYYYAMQENWISAASSGISALKYFNECMTDRMIFYDSYAAIGTYLYWKSRKLEFLQWLPLIDDETAEGIVYLEAAVDNPSYNRFLAANSLIWIYIDLKFYSKAINLAKKMLREYPKNRIYQWALARALEETDKSEAINVYYQILESYGQPSPANEIDLKYKIARQFHLLGQGELALKLCRELLSKKNTAGYNTNELKNSMERVEILCSQLEK